jgi:TPR repeat protein
MATTWFQRLFTGGVSSALKATQAKAQAGDVEAQFSLGLKFATGTEGEGQDYEQAAHWYRQAAEQNHALAQFNLAMMYLEGQGVEQDAAEAAIWFQKAAVQGDAGAQFNLGMNHRRASLERKPTNAAESRIEAYKWFQLSAAQGYKGSAAAYEQVNLNMSREDVAEGNHRADTLRAAMVPAPATA